MKYCLRLRHTETKDKAEKKLNLPIKNNKFTIDPSRIAKPWLSKSPLPFISSNLSFHKKSIKETLPKKNKNVPDNNNKWSEKIWSNKLRIYHSKFFWYDPFMRKLISFPNLCTKCHLQKRIDNLPWRFWEKLGKHLQSCSLFFS